MKNENQHDNSAVDRIVNKWRDQLETQYLAISETGNEHKRTYICSPCSGPTVAAVKRNVQAARFYMWYAYENMNLFAKAPHAYLPVLCSDKNPAERALALRFGLELLELSEIVLVCGDVITRGMKGELSRAAELSIPIVVYDRELYVEVRKLVTRAGASKALVTLGEESSLLRLSPMGLFGE